MAGVSSLCKEPKEQLISLFSFKSGESAHFKLQVYRVIAYTRGEGKVFGDGGLGASLLAVPLSIGWHLQPREEPRLGGKKRGDPFPWAIIATGGRAEPLVPAGHQEHPSLSQPVFAPVSIQLGAGRGEAAIYRHSTRTAPSCLLRAGTPADGEGKPGK